MNCHGPPWFAYVDSMLFDVDSDVSMPQEESLDGPSVEEQKTQRSVRESEVRGSKTRSPVVLVGATVVNIGKVEKTMNIDFRKHHELLVSSDVESFLVKDHDLSFR